jgi:hypothetical protein
MYLTGVSQSLLAAILYDAGLGRFSGYNRMLENALDDTNLHFQQKGIEFRKDELRRILRGDLAQRELARFQHGDRFIDGDELAKEFARLGDLYFEDESRALSVAKEVLQYFVQQFEKYQLADAKTNVPVLLSYLKILSNAASLEHRQMMGSLQRVEQIQQKMEQQIAELAAVSKTRTARETAISATMLCHSLLTPTLSAGIGIGSHERLSEMGNSMERFQPPSSSPGPH